MNIQRTIRLGACLTASLAFAAPARANQELLLPISGSAFTTASNSPVQAVRKQGSVQNWSTSQTAIVEASMGRWAGLARIQIFGVGNGATVTCQVLVATEHGAGAANVYTGSRAVFGAYQLDIIPSFTEDDGYYSVRCFIPASNGFVSSILGVAPDR